jgi:hypothetical protein
VNSIDNQRVTSKNTKITGKKPAKLEMNHKPNMSRYANKIPADRYKNVQPLMVPFDAEEESTTEK